MADGTPETAPYNPTFVSIACGIGCEAWGFQCAGFRCVVVWDLCPRNAAILRRLFPTATVICADIRNKRERRKLPRRVDLVTISLQCQDSSRQNAARGPHSAKHDTGEEMVITGLTMAPRMLVIETVQGFLDLRERFNRLLRLMTVAGYWVNWYVLNANRWVASSRPRLFFIASRVGRDHLSRLWSWHRTARRRVIKDDIECVSLWHPVRPAGMGAGGQRCVIPRGSTYPCVDTKCLLPPPPVYRPHPRDEKHGLARCSSVTPPILN